MFLNCHRVRRGGRSNRVVRISGVGTPRRKAIEVRLCCSNNRSRSKCFVVYFPIQLFLQPEHPYSRLACSRHHISTGRREFTLVRLCRPNGAVWVANELHYLHVAPISSVHRLDVLSIVATPTGSSERSEVTGTMKRPQFSLSLLLLVVSAVALFFGYAQWRKMGFTSGVADLRSQGVLARLNEHGLNLA